MSSKKRGLGRGLDALLGGGPGDEQEEGEAYHAEIAKLPLDLIQRGRFQPRRDFDQASLQELADSIRAQGVVQPIVVRPIDGDRYEIIAGERRWRASQLAGKQEIPVVIRAVDDQSAMAMALIENIQREDLNAVEEASALHRLLNEFGLTHQQVAEAVGKSRATVTNLLRLLELNDDVKEMIESRRIEMGHARALLGLKDAEQSKAARQVADGGLSVRETEELVRNLQSSKTEESKEAGNPGSRRTDPDVQRLIDGLSEKIGAAVHLQQGKGGKGKLVIAYNSLEELDGILDHIR
ncbi:MAG: ParB/RepB/Spo0J family partition protein [Gammaproteobacteria bacterium]|nr:ParB/RepB/Spo0J family partition protein [Gammaproteobacteria bacterium]MBU1656027.1 ParB/RepB/Spo0J family partition protein [Gammaproteobacteria bacterium]MBU1962235.1 ParB/RepB/Spo0J family partition protein [Gammaproteobacteria bacterium]